MNSNAFTRAPSGALYADRSGEGAFAVSLTYNVSQFGEDDSGKVTVVGVKSAGRQFADDAAMLRFASKELNRGKPVKVVEFPGGGYIVPADETPKAPAKGK